MFSATLVFRIVCHIMFLFGNTFAALVACVIISVLPIKTTHRPDDQLTGGMDAEGREESSGSGQNNTEVTESGTTGARDTANAAWNETSQDTAEPSLKWINVKAVRMTALWPKDSQGYVAIPFFLAGSSAATRPDSFFASSVFRYLSDKLCVKFVPTPPRTDCYGSVAQPTICMKADQDSRACFSDQTGLDGGAAAAGQPQVLHVPTVQCPFHEGVQSVTRLLGLLPEHRRRDRDATLRVMVTATGTGRLLFSQSQTAPCEDYEDDTPLDLFSVSGYDTSASTLRHGNIEGIHAIEHGMVIGVRNIRHQWILDYKRQRRLGLSFHDQRDLVRAYGCQETWGCTGQQACQHGGFRDLHCRCVCPPGFGGRTCSERTVPADGDPLASSCSAVLRGQSSFTLAEIGLQFDGGGFYACDITLVPPGCMRPLVVVNTSSLRPLRTGQDTNWDYIGNNWCELYFTLLLKHSALGWRTYCLDYFFNEETLVFMSHANLKQTYGYMKMSVSGRQQFDMVANIAFDVTFVEVSSCGENGTSDAGGAVIKVHSYTVMTAVFSYLAGLMLGVVGWMVVKGLCMTHQEQSPSRDDSPASGASSYDSPSPAEQIGAVQGPPPPRTPSTQQTQPQHGPQQTQPQPAIRLPPPEIRAPTPDSSAPPGGYPPPADPPVIGLPPAGDRPLRPPPDDRPMRPPPSSRPPPPKQELRLPPIAGQAGQSLSPRQGGLRASFVHWGGAALSSLRASFAAVGWPSHDESRPPAQQQQRQQQGGSRPPPPGGHRRPPQGGPRPPPQTGSRPPAHRDSSRPPGGRPAPRYRTSPSRPGARRTPP